jgi:hypothetical protein
MSEKSQSRTPSGAEGTEAEVGVGEAVVGKGLGRGLAAGRCRTCSRRLPHRRSPKPPPVPPAKHPRPAMWTRPRATRTRGGSVESGEEPKRTAANCRVHQNQRALRPAPALAPSSAAHHDARRITMDLGELGRQDQPKRKQNGPIMQQ